MVPNKQALLLAMVLWDVGQPRCTAVRTDKPIQLSACKLGENALCDHGDCRSAAECVQYLEDRGVRAGQRRGRDRAGKQGCLGGSCMLRLRGGGFHKGRKIRVLNNWKPKHKREGENPLQVHKAHRMRKKEKDRSSADKKLRSLSTALFLFCCVSGSVYPYLSLCLFCQLSPPFSHFPSPAVAHA